MALRHAAKKVLFVEQYYYPEGWGGAELPRDVTLALQRDGYLVEVICGSDPYVEVEGDPGPDPAAAGVKVSRLPRLLSGNIHRLKLLRQLWFYLAAAPRLFFRRPPNLFMAQTNPPLVVVLLAAASRVFRKPLIIVAQDLYPESLVVHGLVRQGSLPQRCLSRMFGWAYRSAQLVIVLGPVMRARVIAKGVAPGRIREVSNWATGPIDAPGGVPDFRQEWDLRGAFVVLYSGNLGIGHEFDTLLDGLAAAAREVPRLRFVVVGRGSRLEEVKAGVLRRGLQDITRFRGFVTSEHLPGVLAIADLAVVTLRPGFEGLIVPSKLSGHLARGVPTLYVGPESDVSVVLDQAGGGFNCRTGDPESVHAAICRAESEPGMMQEMSARARAAYRERFSREAGLRQYRDAVARAVQGRSS